LNLNKYITDLCTSNGVVGQITDKWDTQNIFDFYPFLLKVHNPTQTLQEQGFARKVHLPGLNLVRYYNALS
jgi:hypothetical protein